MLAASMATNKVRKSANDWACHTLADTECLVHASNANQHAVTMDTAQATGARNAAGAARADLVCVDLSTTKCRAANKTATALVNATMSGRTSATNLLCKTITAVDGVCRTNAVIIDDAKKVRTAADNLTCITLATNKCKNATDGKPQAVVDGDTVTWKSETDSACKAGGKTATHKMCADSGITSGITGANTAAIC